MEQKKVGRPLLYNSVEELQEKIDKYFMECDKKKEPYTVTGLGLSLGMSRQDLINYGNRDEYFDTIKNAKLKVENYLEKRLITDNSTAGIIFNLKNNYNWKDKQEIEAEVTTTNINITLEDEEDSDNE